MKGEDIVYAFGNKGDNMELGSERCKSVRSLSAVSAGYLRESVGSTRGLRWGNP